MNYIGEIAALLTAFCWATTSIIFTDTSRKIGSMSVNVLRLIFAAVYLLIYISVFSKNINLTDNQYLLLIGSGFVGLVFGDSFLYLSYKIVGPRIGMLMMSLAPAVTSVLSFFLLDEYLSIQAIIGITLIISGVATVIMQKKSKLSSELSQKDRYLGSFFGLLAAIGQGSGLVLTKMAFQDSELDSFVANLIRILSALILITPITFMAKEFLNPVKIFKKHKNVVYLIGAGSIIGPFLGISLSLFAISKTEVGIATALMGTVPIILLPVVKFYYKEHLTIKSILGALIAVSGIFVLFIR